MSLRPGGRFHQNFVQIGEGRPISSTAYKGVKHTIGDVCEVLEPPLVDGTGWDEVRFVRQGTGYTLCKNGGVPGTLKSVVEHRRGYSLSDLSDFGQKMQSFLIQMYGARHSLMTNLTLPSFILIIKGLISTNNLTFVGRAGMVGHPFNTLGYRAFTAEIGSRQDFGHSACASQTHWKVP